MTAKISDELLQELKRAEQTDPQREIPVIVTINGPINRAELEEKGLRIAQVFDFISAVSGTLTPAEAQALAQLDQVERIEFDSEVRIASA
ncbi:MAG: protease inhibitor I9 family protein [Blastocatellia bacterium]